MSTPCAKRWLPGVGLALTAGILVPGCTATRVDAYANSPAIDDPAPVAPYQARGNEPGWLVTITPGYCTDTMTGMPYPDAVTLNFQGQRLHGCGGDPASLLHGSEWVVEDIDGGGIIDRSRVTINFDAAGRISGRAGCNRYTGSYRIGGEAVEIGPLAGTRMACNPALDHQETRFLELLSAVRRFAIRDDGALLLHSGREQTLTARRE